MANPWWKKIPVNNPFNWNSGYASGNDPNTYAFGINDARDGGGGSRKAADRIRQDWQKSGEAREAEQSAADQTLMAQMRGNVDQAKGGMYQSKWAWDADQEKLKSDLEEARKTSRATYSNDIQPRMKSQMEKAEINANSAMSLQDAMDPNNKVAKSTRDLYETQAQGEGRQGLADVGILQAMGAQSAANQMGGVPMTGGQMAAIYGQNQAQAGAAYGSTQRRQQALRDEGLNKGFERSDIAYGQGLDAQDRYRRSVGDYEGAADREQGREGAYRKEYGDRSNLRYDTDKNFLGDVFNLESGYSGLGHQLATGKTTRGMAQDERIYGGGIKQKNAEAQAAAAKQAGREKALGGLVGTVFSGWGGMGSAFGGGDEAAAADAGSGDYTGGDVGSDGAGYGGYALNDSQSGTGLGLTGQMQPSYRRRPSRTARRRYA